MAKDFTEKTFQKVLRGYAPEEVDEYIAYVNEEYGKLEQRNADNARKLAMALHKLDDLHKQQEREKAEVQRKAEQTLEKAAAQARALVEEAETSAAKTKKSAQVKAEQFLQEASAAAKILRERARAESEKAEEEAAGLRATIAKAYGELLSFRDGLFASYNRHMESMEDIVRDATGFAEQTVEACGGPDLMDYVRSIEEKVEADKETAVSYEEEPYEDAYAEAGLTGEQEPDAMNAALATDGSEEAYYDEAPAADPYIEYYEGEAEAPAYGDAFEEEAYDERTADRPRYDTERYEDPFVDPYEEALSYAESLDFNDDTEDGGDYGYGSDFEKEPADFRDMDALFSQGEDELSLTDEFNIVFAGSDSRRNVEEIRRQEIVPAEAPQKIKKHKLF